jgi:hypothetical protein
MGNSKFTPHYWQHKCPATNPEDGDGVAAGSPGIKYQHIPLHERFHFKDESILGKQCGAQGCQYVANEETVILNKDFKEIRNLGGKNLYPFRTRAKWMKCCRWSCSNQSTTGHSPDNSILDEGLFNHTCGHALDYHRVMGNRRMEQRFRGCTCVMLNMYNEPVETWEPQGRGVPLPGGPLDLDNKYHQKKEEEAMALQAKQT